MSKFEVGQRVAVYGGIAGVGSHQDRKVGTVTAIEEGGYVAVQFDKAVEGQFEWFVHPKQCRKLRPKAKGETVYVSKYRPTGTIAGVYKSIPDMADCFDLYEARIVRRVKP